MTKKLLFAFAVAGLAIASAKSYSVDLFQTAYLGNTELAPGHYSVDVTDQKAVIRNGKVHGEAPVKMESAETKYNTTAVRYTNGDGKMHIQEIHIGGSKTKLVFTE
ncbi:MAG: hypothetical protein C5B51_07895 [Terriglobia bacterium]|nr:MAG: hypothetical protein C5B51_07895 [Terriglobia bacterium]